MAEYHVECSAETGRIYAGTTNKKGDKWINRTDVTEKALIAVRDHFLRVKAEQEEDNPVIGYQWNYDDGTSITLRMDIETKEKEKETL